MSGSTSTAIVTSARSAASTLFSQPLALLFWNPSGQVLSQLLTAVYWPWNSPLPCALRHHHAFDALQIFSCGRLRFSEIPMKLAGLLQHPDPIVINHVIR